MLVLDLTETTYTFTSLNDCSTTGTYTADGTTLTITTETLTGNIDGHCSDAGDIKTLTYTVDSSTLTITDEDGPMIWEPVDGASAPVPVATGTDFTGTWSGSWYSTTYGMGGEITIDLTQTGATTFTGSGTVEDSPCVTDGTVSGTTSGNNMAFGIGMKSGESLDFTGTYTSNAISGTWTMDAGTCANLDQIGTFSLTR